MIVIEDNFYPNPDEVREKALELFFHPGTKGRKINFAGARSICSFSAQNRIYCRNRISKLINRNIVAFPAETSNSAFTLGLNKNPLPNWVHHDQANITEKKIAELDCQMFAAVCYLSPNPPRGYGTGLFRHIKNKSNWVLPNTKLGKKPTFKGEWPGCTEFALHTYADNLYNRIIVYPARYWHAPYDAGFGHDRKTGRLIQVFFFNAEKSCVERGYEWT
ncbi:hypothetical protein OAA32_00240 [bacterium]|nr:hypothetical protein [bacterium]